MHEFIQWLEGLKGGAPTVIGALIGSIIGFITLVLGALFNAKLNRNRDDRLRKVEVRGVAVAIRAELSSIEGTLTDNAKRLRETPPQPQKSFCSLISRTQYAYFHPSLAICACSMILP